MDSFYWRGNIHIGPPENIPWVSVFWTSLYSVACLLQFCRLQRRSQAGHGLSALWLGQARNGRRRGRGGAAWRGRRRRRRSWGCRGGGRSHGGSGGRRRPCRGGRWLGRGGGVVTLLPLYGNLHLLLLLIRSSVILRGRWLRRRHPIAIAVAIGRGGPVLRAWRGPGAGPVVTRAPGGLGHGRLLWHVGRGVMLLEAGPRPLGVHPVLVVSHVVLITDWALVILVIHAAMRGQLDCPTHDDVHAPGMGEAVRHLSHHIIQIITDSLTRPPLVWWCSAMRPSLPLHCYTYPALTSPCPPPVSGLCKCRSCPRWCGRGPGAGAAAGTRSDQAARPRWPGYWEAPGLVSRSVTGLRNLKPKNRLI